MTPLELILTGWGVLVGGVVLLAVIGSRSGQ